MQQVPDAEAHGLRQWLDAKGMKFATGSNPETDLTDEQILGQCKMYIAALRIADDFGCDTIWHPVPTGLEGPGAGLRSGGGAAQQLGSAAGDGAQ